MSLRADFRDLSAAFGESCQNFRFPRRQYVGPGVFRARNDCPILRAMWLETGEAPACSAGMVKDLPQTA
jgi:hypothetical protein